MEIAILYLSRDGQTQKIANFIAQQINTNGNNIHIYNLLEVINDIHKIKDVDTIIIGASIRYGHFDRTLYQFIEQNSDLLTHKQTAFFSVNLTARKADKNTPGTNNYTRKFLQRITWKPQKIAVFAGALFYPRYTWLDRKMIQFIMYLTGGETDASKEIEYTDWEKVAAFAQSFD